MIKKRFLFLYAFFLVILVTLSYGENSISIDLKNKNLGPLQGFEGTIDLVFNGNATKSSRFIAKIDSSEVSSSSIYNLFLNSSIKFNIKEGTLTRVGEPWTSKKVLSSSGSSLFGILLPANTKTISSLSFFVTGFGGPLYIDVDNDGVYDYKYRGGISSFSSDIYPIGVDQSVVTDGFATVNGNGNLKRCSNFNITFEKLYNESVVAIFANVKKEASGSDLSLSIETKTCDVNSSTVSNATYQNVSCNVTLTNLGANSYSVCAFVKDGSSLSTYYRLPSRADKNYFSLTLKKAQYVEDITSGGIVSDTKIKNKVNEFLSSCVSNCILVLNLTLGSLGEASVSNILVRDSSSIEFNSFYDISKLEDYLILNGTYKLLLSKMPNLLSPATKGGYNLEISYGLMKAQTPFNVSDVPVAVIDSSTKQGVVESAFEFSGARSSSINGKIVKYMWDFGDGSTASGEKVTHTYSKNGEFVLTLYVEDVKGILSPQSKINIKISTFDEVLPNFINDTKTSVSSSRNYFDSSSGELREVLEAMSYDRNLRTYSNNITAFEKEYYTNQNLSDEQKRIIYNSLDNINRNLISYVSFSAVIREGDTPLLNDLISVDYFKEDVSDQAKIDFRDLLYEYNSRNLKIDTKIYYMVVFYSSGVKNITLVKKNIRYAIDTVKILENLKENDPDDVVVISPSEFEINKEFNLISFDAKNTQEEDIVYLLAGEAKEIPSTIIYNGRGPVENLYFCGDKICTEPYEDATNCEVDCKKKRPVGFYIGLVLIVLAGVYYFNFYKGKGNYRDLGNFLAVRIIGRRIFTNKKDLEALDSYVVLKISQNFKEHDMRDALIKKGWTNKQIDFAFDRARK